MNESDREIRASTDSNAETFYMTTEHVVNKSRAEGLVTEDEIA